tara:strand:- start:20887 stop:22230 length:1344 start_codon:yes stop_codon:yes gene_type:complete
MKKILFFFLFVNAVTFAQFIVKGTMQEIEDPSWVLLYKIEGTKEVFLKNTQIKKEGSIGLFEFILPDDSKQGSYRIKFNLKENGFIDFLFNKEDIAIDFNPKDPNNTIIYKKSEENKIYTTFLNDIASAQFKIDSIQREYFKSPSEILKEFYNSWLIKLKKIQKNYIQISQGTLVYHFIKASDRYNANEIVNNPEEYITNSINHFFDHIEFSNEVLYNSSFLVDRISDYIFYLNYSTDQKKQKELFKKASSIVIEKIENLSFKTDVIEFLISQFTVIQSPEVVEYLFANHYYSLPKEKQNVNFKKKIFEKISIAIGMIAPDFSWEENGKQILLSNIKDGLSYLLIFYSTECSHCLKEVPKVFEFMKLNKNTKVIAFAMETSKKKWMNYKNNMPGWHHVLGLKKWENKIAKMYQVNSTPTYFVLGMNKEIISKPERIEDLKLVLEQLN